jgi:hypothetical protein
MPADTRPDYHFLLIAPNLGAEWLFDAARAYWDTFRPTVIDDFYFLIFVPPERSISVTVIARRDVAPNLGVQLSQIRPEAYLDAVVYDQFDAAREELNRRAQTQQPFGVPLTSPMATLDPNAPPIPTARLSSTRPPAGFITATPSPAPTTTNIEGTPAVTPEASEESATRAPVTPASGPITGGG